MAVTGEQLELLLTEAYLHGYEQAVEDFRGYVGAVKRRRQHRSLRRAWRVVRLLRG